MAFRASPPALQLRLSRRSGCEFVHALFLSEAAAERDEASGAHLIAADTVMGVLR